MSRRRKKNEELRVIFWGTIGWYILIIIILVSVFFIYVNQEEKNLPENDSLLERPLIIQGNSLMAVRLVYYPTYKVYGSLVEDIIYCESGGEHYNSDGTIKIGKAKEVGIAQFKIETWNWMSELSGFQGYIYDKQDQLWLLNWAIENGYIKHWTCAK